MRSREIELPLAPDAEHRRATLTGTALIALSASGFGAMAIFARLAYASGADLTGILAFRFTLAALVLAVMAWLRRTAFPPRGQLWVACAMGGIGYVGQSACFFGALQFASAGLVALLLYLYPVLVGLLAALFLGERLTGLKVLLLIVSFAGVALTIGGGAGQPLGIGLGIAAALIYAIYITVGGRYLPRTDPLAVSTLVCASAAAVFLAWAAVNGAKLPASAGGWWALLGIALLSTVVAILTFFAGLARLGASRAAILSTLEPVTTLALAAAFLHEAVSAWQIAGGGLILTAAVLTAAYGRAP